MCVPVCWSFEGFALHFTGLNNNTSKEHEAASKPGMMSGWEPRLIHSLAWLAGRAA